MKELSSSILKSRNFQRVILTTNTSSKKAIVETSNHLKQIAANKGLVSLSASQLNSKFSIFVMLQKYFMKNHKFNSYRTNSNQYSVYINPKILDYSVDEVLGWEQCPSYPNIRFQISRSAHIITEYEKTFKDKGVTREQLKGFEAVVFQHQFTHLQCINLFDIAQDIDLRAGSVFPQKIKQKLKQQFTKFKLQRDQRKKALQTKQQKEKTVNIFSVQTLRGATNIHEEFKNNEPKTIGFKYSQCKSLRDFIEFQVIDPI